MYMGMLLIMLLQVRTTEAGSSFIPILQMKELRLHTCSGPTARKGHRWDPEPGGQHQGLCSYPACCSPLCSVTIPLHPYYFFHLQETNWDTCGLVDPRDNFMPLPATVHTTQALNTLLLAVQPHSLHTIVNFLIVLLCSRSPLSSKSLRCLPLTLLLIPSISSLSVNVSV